MRFSIACIALSVCLLFKTAVAQGWKSYPFHEEGTLLTFPADEGFHPGEPVEWWYATGHLTGDSTGTNYSVMFTFFHYPQFNFDGFRIFNVANDDAGEFYDETLPLTYQTIAQDHLELKATVNGHTEEFVTLRDSSNELKPFEYHIKATQANGSIDLTYKCLKRPLVLGDNGFFYQGITGYTYYYSLVMLEVTGTMTYKGVTETVHGTGWIDRQWGQFNPYNGEKYEWFSVQLSNGVATNIWNIFNTANEIPDTATYRLCSVYKNDSTDLELNNFKFERKRFDWMTDSLRCYAQQWHFVSNGIDIVISTLHDNHEVHLPFRFYEGTTTVTGTVDGVPVTGVGFAECLHSYAKPQVMLTAPVAGAQWNEAQPITWQLTNPDSGRVTYYDLEYSTDNNTFSTIAANLTDTSYYWNAAGVVTGSAIWLRVRGHSIDNTLAGSYTMSNSFSYEPTGIYAAANEFTLSILPNPANGNFQLTLPAHAEGAMQLKVFNGVGAEVFSKQVDINSSGKIIPLELNNLSAGTYFVSVASGEKTFHGKIVIAQ